MPARLFRNLKPRSQAALRHSIEALESGTNGLLAIQIRDGKTELVWIDGPAEIHIDPWRMKPAS